MRGVLAGLLVVGSWVLANPTWAAEGEPPTPPPAAPARPQAPAASKPEAPSPPSDVKPDDHDNVVRGMVTTRGPDDSRVGIGLSGEMRSPLPWGLVGGPGFELDLWQSQRDGNVVSFLPVYWALEYYPVRRFSNAFLSGRFGFDVLGQEGDDTLASRNYYAVGIGLITHRDRPKKVQWEILYSRMRGAFSGIGLSVGYRF